MSIRSKIVAYTDGSGVFWFLVSLVVLTLGFYIYSVNWTVVMVAERDELESQIVEARADIATLEAKYITEVNTVSKELAYSLGYEDSPRTIFVQKRAVSLANNLGTTQ